MIVVVVIWHFWKNWMYYYVYMTMKLGNLVLSDLSRCSFELFSLFSGIEIASVILVFL